MKSKLLPWCYSLICLTAIKWLQIIQNDSKSEWPMTLQGPLFFCLSAEWMPWGLSNFHLNQALLSNFLIWDDYVCYCFRHSGLWRSRVNCFCVCLLNVGVTMETVPSTEKANSLHQGFEPLSLITAFNTVSFSMFWMMSVVKKHHITLAS